MTPELVGALWTFAGLSVVALIGLIANVLVKRMRSRASEPEMWKRLDELAVEVYGDGHNNLGLKKRVSVAEARADLAEKKAAAMGRIIRDVVEQWQGPPPRLNPDDLALLDTTVLPASHWWRRKPPPKEGTNT